MKLMLPVALTAFFLAACDWADWSDERKAAAKDAARQQIQTMNAAGFDPIKLDEAERVALKSFCKWIPVLHPELESEAEEGCALVVEVAQ